MPIVHKIEVLRTAPRISRMTPRMITLRPFRRVQGEVLPPCGQFHRTSSCANPRATACQSELIPVVSATLENGARSDARKRGHRFVGFTWPCCDMAGWGGSSPGPTRRRPWIRSCGRSLLPCQSARCDRLEVPDRTGRTHPAAGWPHHPCGRRDGGYGLLDVDDLIIEVHGHPSNSGASLARATKDDRLMLRWRTSGGDVTQPRRGRSDRSDRRGHPHRAGTVQRF